MAGPGNKRRLKRYLFQFVSFTILIGFCIYSGAQVLPPPGFNPAAWQGGAR